MLPENATATSVNVVSVVAAPSKLSPNNAVTLAAAAKYSSLVVFNSASKYVTDVRTLMTTSVLTTIVVVVVGVVIAVLFGTLGGGFVTVGVSVEIAINL